MVFSTFETPNGLSVGRTSTVYISQMTNIPQMVIHSSSHPPSIIGWSLPVGGTFVPYSAAQESTSQSTVALRALGAKAVPWLIADLKVSDTWADKYYVPLFNKLSTNVQSCLPRPRPRGVIVRQGAAEGLKDLGWMARSAMPALVEAMGDPDLKVRQIAFAALDRLRPEFADAKSGYANFMKFKPSSAALYQLVQEYRLHGRRGWPGTPHCVG